MGARTATVIHHCVVPNPWIQLMSNRARLAFATLLLMLPPVAVKAEVVSEWNEIASLTLVANTDLQNPGMASRTMAMMNLAIYDSLAMTRTGGETFYSYGDVPRMPDASGAAAAATAAHAVLSATYPDQRSSLDAMLSASLSTLPSGTGKDLGVELGTSVGQSIVSYRENDGYDTMVEYIPTNEVGHWQPDPLNPGQEAWGPAWGSVKPFRLSSVSSFMPPPPPELTSPQYAAAFNEVKALGSLHGSTRTPEQTDIGKFWAYDRVGMGTPMRLYNQAMRNIAEEMGNSTEENAEMFAKAAVAMADAGIVAWNAKFEYDYWRPVTGIREADADGNMMTEADPDWVPLGAPDPEGQNFTPPFPTYTSGHATFGAALFASIADFYGTDEIAFELSSDELDGMTRSFSSLSEAAAENGRSRVYLGIHWNFDDLVAQGTGQDVARFVSSQPFVSVVPEPMTGRLLMSALLLAGYCRRRK